MGSVDMGLPILALVLLLREPYASQCRSAPRGCVAPKPLEPSFGRMPYSAICTVRLRSHNLSNLDRREEGPLP